MSDQRNASPASTASASNPSDGQHSPLSAVVKGAGPSGLAAAVALAQKGFKVRVVEKRSDRPIGQGRQNMAAMRPEALRRLEELGALPFLLASRDDNGNSSKSTRMTAGLTVDEIGGNVLEWDLKRYPPAELERFREPDEPLYETPESLALQFPSTFVTHGDLEDALRQAGEKLGIEVLYDATISLALNKASSAYSVTLTQGTSSSQDLGMPDLVVLASGKNDPAIPIELNFERRIGVVLEAANLPDLQSSTDSRALKLSDGADHELESQIFSVFGVRHPFATEHNGTINHVVRKYRKAPEAKTFQPVIEIQMNHADAAHLILHHPRSKTPFKAHSPELEKYVVSRINDRLAPEEPFTSIQQLKDLGIITWGDPLRPVTVETSTAPQYAYGSNLVLIGDAAISCSPSSGMGAEVAVTADSKSIAALGESLVKICSTGKRLDGSQEATMKALDEFNRSKAESAVLWSQASRIFYLKQTQADDILERIQREETKA